MKVLNITDVHIRILKIQFQSTTLCHEIEPIKAEIITQKCNAENLKLLTELWE